MEKRRTETLGACFALRLSIVENFPSFQAWNRLERWLLFVDQLKDSLPQNMDALRPQIVGLAYQY